MKQIKRLLLLLIMTSFVIVESKAYDFEYDNLRYTIIDNASVYVSGYNHNLDSSDGIIMAIPGFVTYNGVTYKVTEISNSAFNNFRKLWDITIPNTVTEIGDKAFQNCVALQYVWCQASTPPTIYSSTFNNIYSKCHLYVRKHMTQTYMNTNYWSNFGNRISELPDFAVNNIYYYIIDDNSLEVSDNGSNSYSGNVTIPARITVDGKTYQVTKIGTDAFYYCDNLVKVNMPNTIKSIDRHAFYNCSKLKSITIPESVTSIDDEALAYMYLYLDHIYFNAISCDDFSNPGNTGVYLETKTEITFGDKVQRIPAWIPWAGKNSNLTIPNSVTSIGDGAFYCWPNITELTIGSNVQLIGDSAFINASIQKINSPQKTPPEIKEKTFNRITLHNSKVFVPARCQINYIQQPLWKEFYFIIQNETISGDVNCDSEINVADINSIIDRILSDYNEFDYNADVNNDGEINIADINSIIQIILDENITPGENPDYYTFNVKGVSFKMIKVDGGTFMMGSDDFLDNNKLRQVTLSSFYMGETEVTQALWQAVMGNNPSYHQSSSNPDPSIYWLWFKDDFSRPVENVSWDDCRLFTAKLSQITGKSFRLPTEAEWEYAARGGNYSQGYQYAGSNNINDVAWSSYNGIIEDVDYAPHSVAQLAPNELGLYDMSGNIIEMCLDLYHYSVNTEPQVNPTGALGDEPGFYRLYRVIRGGHYNSTLNALKVLYRESGIENASRVVGLRLAF